jgi:tRNA A-37 threonylcarbamoyl transferase component Bud32
MGNTHDSRFNFTDLIQLRDKDGIISAIKSGINLNITDSQGRSALRIALELGEADIFKTLWDSGVAFVPPLPNGESPLHAAVRLGHYQLARLILREKHAFCNLKNSKDRNGQTPLHIATSDGNAEMVALLLKYNCQINIRDNLGRTPVDLAQSSHGNNIDEIIEQFTCKEIIVKAPKTSSHSPGKNEKSKSTHGSRSTYQEEETESIETAIKECKLPLIKNEDLLFMEVINRGSSCVVFKGRWRGTEIAIKQFKPEYSASSREFSKFLKELEILSYIRHPNLLLIMGLSVDSPNLCIVTEYLPRSSLFHLLHRAKVPLTMEQRLNIAIEITQGLAYLHTNNPPIIHRDLKPENILVNFIQMDEGLTAKIADFGLARSLSYIACGEQTTVCIGTTRFMAPELFDRSSNIGLAIDIWALGCIFIELFSNKRPWDYISSANTNCIYFEIFQRKAIPIPSVIPSGIRNLISECCSYDSLKRPAALDILEYLKSSRSSV